MVMLITSLPYAIGFAVQDMGYRFTGFLFAVEDGNSYIAKMVSGTNGSWLFRTPYTAFPQKGAMMYLPYLLLGKLAWPPGLHEQLVAIYQLFRIGAGILVILAIYDFLAFFIINERLRRLGLVLITLGGGLGWILVLSGNEKWLGSIPLEFYSPETFGFLGIFGLPHLAFARACMLWAILAYLRSIDPVNQTYSLARQVIKLSVFWFLAGVMQPLTAMAIGIVLIIHLSGIAIWQIWLETHGSSANWATWRRLVRLVIAAGILPGLLVLYNAWEIFRDPFLKTWAAQNILQSPHPLHYLLAFGLLVPYALFGGYALLRDNPRKGWLIVGWALALPVLAYIPVNVQRRLPEGEWVAWVLLAMVALEVKSIAEQRSGMVKRRLIFVPFLLLFPSTLLIFATGILSSSHAMLPVFRPADEVAIFEFLGQNSPPDGVVLTSYETGNALPAWAPLRVVIGHGPESVNLAELRPLVNQFYESSSIDEQRLELLRRFNVNYVFWGPIERKLGSWDPGQASYLKLIHQVGEYQVFEVLTRSSD
jgi:hypothetical protein